MNTRRRRPSYTVKVANYALEQMKEIVQYISETLQAPEAAQKLLISLKTEMAKCSEMPSRNPLLTREPWNSQGIRRIIVKNFMAYYWIDEQQQTVWFIAVVYSKRDQTTELLKAITQ